MAILLIDMDDTIAEYLPTVVNDYNKATGDNLDWMSLTSWEDTGRKLGTFFETPGLYLDLPVIKDSQMVLRELSINHTIYFVTAAPTPLSCMEKKIWVDLHFPFIGQRKVITTFEKELIRGDLLFDDSPVFIDKFPGIKVLKNTNYNRFANADYKVDTWMHFLNLIEALEYNGMLKRNGE